MAVTATDKYFCCFLLLYFVSSLLFQFFTKNRRRRVQLRPPPSPPALPIIGHLPLLTSRTDPLHKSLKTLAFRYAPFMKISIGTSKWLVVSNASIAKQVLDNIHGPNFTLIKPNSHDYLMLYDVDLRKLYETELGSGLQFHHFADTQKQEIFKLLEILVNCSKEGEACDLGLELVKLTISILCQMTMNIGSGSNESKRIRTVIDGINVEIGAKSGFRALMGRLGKLGLFRYGRRMKALVLQFDELVEEILAEHEERRRHGGHERLIREQDLMDILLDTHEDQAAEVKLTRNDIKGILLEIFMAGSEPLSVALKWTLAEIINHPNVLNKLREEIIGVVGLHRLVEHSDFPKLAYLQAVVKESLRLHPPSPLILRKCKEDCKINGYDIIANSRIMINTYAIMRDPDTWNYPTEFIPERFLENSIDNNQRHQVDMKGQNIYHLPFGSGSRACPGANLAPTVMHMVIGGLVQCFDFEVLKGGRIKADMEEASAGLTAGMAHPLVCFPVIKHISPLEISTLAK